MSEKAEWNVVLLFAGDSSDPTLTEIAADLVVTKANVLAHRSINVFIELVLGDATSGKANATRRAIVAGTLGPVSVVNDVDTGDASTLIGLRQWCATTPAKRTAIFIYGHGNGVADWDTPKNGGATRRRVAPPPKGGGPSSALGSSWSYLDALTIPELADAMKAAGLPKVNLVGLNGCEMSMLEIAYELNATDAGLTPEVMLGSELDDTASGWPYVEILTRLAAAPTSSAEAFAEIVLDEYRKLDPAPKPNLVSALRPSATLAVAAELAALSPTLKGHYSKVKEARDDGKWCSPFPYLDVVDLAERISQRGVAVAALQSALAKVTLGTAPVNGVWSDFHGFSVYFPKDATIGSKEMGAYFQLAFSGAAQWGDYLVDFAKH